MICCKAQNPSDCMISISLRPLAPPLVLCLWWPLHKNSQLGPTRRPKERKRKVVEAQSEARIDSALKTHSERWSQRTIGSVLAVPNIHQCLCAVTPTKGRKEKKNIIEIQPTMASPMMIVPSSASVQQQQQPPQEHQQEQFNCGAQSQVRSYLITVIKGGQPFIIGLNCLWWSWWWWWWGEKNIRGFRYLG